MTTTYKIAETAQDYKRVHALIKSEGMEDAALAFPTIMAIEDDEVVGCLGTNTQQSMIIAGPLVLKSDKKRSFTIIRLVEAYELVMRHCKIKSFIFSTDLTNEKWLEYIDTVLGFTPYHKDAERAWFIRKLEN